MRDEQSVYLIWANADVTIEEEVLADSETEAREIARNRVEEEISNVYIETHADEISTE